MKLRHFLCLGLLLLSGSVLAQQPFSPGDLAFADAAGYHPTAVNWAKRVVTNSGAAPSDATVRAVSTFCYAIDNAGLTSKLITVNIYAPDNLTACLTPLIVGGGNDPWGNQGPFVSGDLSVNGLQGNGTSKYLQPGFNPSTAYANDNSATEVVMISSGSTESKGDIGNWSSGGANFAFYSSFSGSAFWDCWNSAGGRISGANASAAGYYCVTRTSSTSSAIYKGLSNGGLSVIFSSTSESSIGSRPNWNAFVHAQANSGGTANTVSSKRFSFAAFGLGMSVNDAQALYNAVYALRVALGGGQI